MKKFTEIFELFKKFKFKNCFNFKTRKNTIITVMALVECILIIGVMTFAWIESASSLVIKGNDLPISSNLNYRFDVKDGATNMVDLSTYFRPTALYQMAKASSPDGQNLYFKKSNALSYRLGDTTDFNTSYYNIDFQIHNETPKSYNYYFESSEIFDVTSDKITDENVLKAAEGAFRISVTAGTNTSNTRVYSRDNAEYGAICSTAGNVTQEVSSIGLSGNSEYRYETNTTNSINVFSTTGGGDDTKVNLKIWFEEKDPGFAGLSDANKKALLGATVSIHIRFVNSASNFQTFFFDDYTFSTQEGHEGLNVTTEDQTKKMYFYYSDGKTTSVVPMTTTTSPKDGVTHWVTASDAGDPTPRIPDDMRKDLAENPSRGYFFYGTVSDAGVPSVAYRWNITAPAVNDGNVYIFKALSVNKVNATTVGYGVWDNIPITLLYFRDQAVAATDKSYNAYGYQFVNKAGQGRLYLNNDGTVKNASTKMYYDSASGLWKGYYPTTETPYFMYLKSDNFSSANTMVKWNAGAPTRYDEVDSEKYVYTGLGYIGTGLVDSQASGGTTGVGTWGPTEHITFSTELVDASMNKDYRYKVGIHSGSSSTYYYMTKYQCDLKWGVYVPKDSGNTANTYLSFQRLANNSTSTIAGEWNTTKTVRDGSSTFYATDMAATTSKGQWHIAVVVDSSADNVINDVLTNVEGSKLEYSVDGGTTYEAMNKLDNYRWYTNDFASTVTTISYCWTAYSGAGVNEAVFSYGHDLSNGIYFNITE